MSGAVRVAASEAPAPRKRRSKGSGLPVVIVGAGPCGLAAALACEQAGMPTITFDKGCLVSSIAAYPTYLTFFSTPEKIAIGGIPFALAAEKPSRRDALAYYRTVVATSGLVVRQYERVERVEPCGNGFVVLSRTADGQVNKLEARAVVIATGYFGTPNRLGVPGEDLPHVTHWYREGHEAFQRRALVVGGGNSAVEAALDLYRHGAHVTLAHAGPTWDRNIKPWIKPDIEARIAEGSIAARWDARVTAIRPGTAMLETPDGTIEEPADHVYLMTGFTPAPGLLADLDVPVDPATGIPAHDPATMETPVPGVFLAGVLASGYDANKIFIENGRGHGALIAQALLRR